MTTQIRIRSIRFAAAMAWLTLTSLQPVQAAFVLNTSDGQFDPGVDNQGWWSPSFSNNDGNDNYFVGTFDGGTTQLRNFFTFDLSGVSLAGHNIVGAVLQVRRGSGSGNPTETITFFHVATAAATLNANDGISTAIFDDLGTGTSYGTYSVSTTGNPDSLVSFQLGAAAIADITTAAGAGFFSVGGALPSSSFGNLFGSTFGGGSIQRLLIVLDSDPDADGDGIIDDFDNCPSLANPDQADNDGDGIGDACDICPTVYNPGQEDNNNNGIGDACEPPPNDNFANAETVTLPFYGFAATFGATTELGEPSPCGSIGATVWYRYVADITTTLNAQAFGSFDTVLAAYTGSSLATLTVIACDDAFFDSFLQIPVTAGQTYYFQVGGFSGLGGGLYFNLYEPDSDGDGVPDSRDNCPLTYNPGQEDLNNNGIGDACEPPRNDNFADAVLVTPANLPFTDALPNGGATTEPGEPFPPCVFIGHSVWYRFTADTDAIIEVDTMGTLNFYSALAAYTGTSLEDLTPVACNVFYLDTVARIVVPVAAGQTVFIQAGGYYGFYYGDLVVNISEIPALPVDAHEPNNSAAEATPVACGETVADANIALGDVDWYRIDLAAGATLLADVDTDGSSLDSILAVYGPDGTSQLAFVDNNPAPGEPFSFDPYLEFTAPAQGTYFVVVASAYDYDFNGGDDGISFGSYVVSFECLPPCNAEPERGPNGHFYQVVNAFGITWEDAKAAAEGVTFGCLKGHLATITSYEEDVFIDELRRACRLQQLWIGGAQPANELVPTANWTWITGEGAISGVNGGETYSNWRFGEPNDFFGPASEQFLSVGLFGEFVWNDEINPSSGIYGYVVEFEDREIPTIVCVPGPNPAGKVPPAGRKKPGTNPDGFYQLLATDNCDEHPQIWVKDNISGKVFGPFANGDVLKIVSAPGVPPRQKPGAGVVRAMLQVKGDTYAWSVDAAGNLSVPVTCSTAPRNK